MNDTHKRTKTLLCKTAARKISKELMKTVKTVEQDIGNACMVYNQEYEQKLGRPILTIQEFEDAVTKFSKLPKEEIEKLILKGKEYAKEQKETI
jgi:hypothetical protein